MIRIIHISDFHLEEEVISTEKSEIISALVKDLKNYANQESILIFTGDLIDKGGIAFSERANAFECFESYFIQPILKEIPGLIGRFFVVPGNHDVFRDKIDIYSELGIKEKLVDTKSVSEFINKNKTNSKHLDRLSDYKIWEKHFYSGYIGYKESNFDVSFVLQAGNYKVGLSCLNSSWLCKDETDKGNLILGKAQVDSSVRQLEQCHIKLAMLHHPIEFLSEFDRESIKPILLAKYDLLLTGHVHELSSTYTQDLYGNIFISISNSTIADHPKERKYVNGYTILDYFPNDKVVAHYRKYVEIHNVFVANTDIGTEDGKKSFKILKDEKLERFEVNQEIVTNIENRFFEKLDEDIIMSSAATETNCSIDSLFVEPTILNAPQGLVSEEKAIQYTIEKILNEEENFLIYGMKESGKTILLDKMFKESIKRFNQFNRIPVLIKFGQFKKVDIIKVVREFISVPMKEIDAFLRSNKIILFIDDIQFTEKSAKQISSLKNLINEYDTIRIVATSDLVLENVIPTDYLKHNDAFKFYISFIQNFNSSQIRQLVEKWFAGKEIDMNDNMQRLIKSFVDYGLPKTPLSVTLFLWIFEKQEKRPINNAVLVEMFIENLLEKTKFENIYSDTFDFKNKQRLLSFVAKFMKDNGNEDLSYSVDYVDLLNFIKDYLSSRFTGQPQKVLDDFIRRGVLSYEDVNLIRFKSAFFFSYFLALHFDYDLNFKAFVFRDDNYLEYIDEINYYTGLKRDDFSVLSFTQEKLNEIFSEFNSDIQENFKKIDGVLEVREVEQTLTYEVASVAQEDKMTDRQLDEVYDETLANIPVQKLIPNKRKMSKSIDTVLKLAANVLKNSEDVDDFDAKVKAYENTLRSSISFLMHYRDSLIKYYLEFKKKPDSLPKNIDFHLFIQILPLFHQVVLYEWMGSQKLRPVILHKMEADMMTLNISDYEKALSIFIFSDVKGVDYPEKIKRFVKSTKYKYLKDLTFLKLFSYFHLRNNEKELDEYYLKLMSEIKEDMGKVRKVDKDKFKKELKDTKKV